MANGYERMESINLNGYIFSAPATYYFYNPNESSTDPMSIHLPIVGTKDEYTPNEFIEKLYDNVSNFPYNIYKKNYGSGIRILRVDDY